MMMLLTALLTALPSHAINCMRNNPVENYRNLVHKVAVVDEAGRKTEEEYAAAKALPLHAVQNRFAATGELKCGNVVLTAQLTGANNVITTAAHAFFKPSNCQKISTPESCIFKTKVGSVEQESKVSTLAGMGFKCPALPKPNDDWAVLKLEDAIKDVEPYDIPRDEDQVVENESVTSVSAGSEDFSRIDPKTKKKFFPKTIDECKTRKVYAFSSPIYFESDCDGADGISGGSVLKRARGRDVLVGITKTNDETQKQLDRAVKTGKMTQGSYKEGSWATYHVPLNDEFLDTVKNAIEITL